MRLLESDDDSFSWWFFPFFFWYEEISFLDNSSLLGQATVLVGHQELALFHVFCNASTESKSQVSLR